MPLYLRLSLISILFPFFSNSCNAGKEAAVYPEKKIKSELAGGWVVSAYCRILERTKSPLAASAACKDYHEISYAPGIKFFDNQSDSSYWIFLDSAAGMRAAGFPIRFDPEKPKVVVLTGDLQDTLAILETNYGKDPDRLLLIKPNGDSLIFHRTEREFQWGHPTSRYTNKVILAGTFFPILDGIPDTTNPIRFAEIGESRDFSKWLGDATGYRFRIDHRFRRDDTTDYMSIRYPGSKIDRVFLCKFGKDTLRFVDDHPWEKARKKIFVLVRAGRRPNEP